MRSGRQAQHQNPRIRIPEPWNWLRPVLLFAVGLAPNLADTTAVLPQPQTALTANNRSSHLLQYR